MTSHPCSGCGHDLKEHAPRALARQDLQSQERNRALLQDDYPCWHRDSCPCKNFVWRPGQLFEVYAEHKGLKLEDDPGLRLVRDAFRELAVDKEWSDFSGRGFRWWGYQLMQYVWADEPKEERGEMVTAVHAETGILHDVTSENAQTLAALMGLTATLNAYVVDPANRTFNMRCTVYVHTQNEEWLSKLFRLAVAMQAAEAQAKIDNGIAETLRGSPASSPHPRSGPRAVRDEMLGVGHWVADLGKDATKSYSAADLAEALSMLDGTWTVAFAGETFAGEIPLDADAGDKADNESYAQAMRAAAQDLSPAQEASDVLRVLWFQGRGIDSRSVVTGDSRFAGAKTALLQVLPAERHPEFGHGALLRLNLPLFFDDQTEAARLASEMNLGESRYWTGVHQIGSWCISPERNLVHVIFLPAYGKNPSWLVNLMLGSRNRVNWARWYLEQRLEPTR